VESTNTLGRYQIIREIARSNDVIYEAVDPAINRRVALKELNVPPTVSGASGASALNGSTARPRPRQPLASEHRHDLRSRRAERAHFIAMEYLEGQDLQDSMQVRGALPVQEAVDIALQLLRRPCLRALQRRDPPDIKPDNVQLLPGGL